METNLLITPTNKEALNAFDSIIGENVRKLRMYGGLSQDHIAQRMGLTFQQVQKYERGANRISGSRFVQLSSIFNVSPLAFFQSIEGLPDTVPISLNFYVLRLMACIEAVKGTDNERDIRNMIEGFLSTLEMLTQSSKNQFVSDAVLQSESGVERS